ncbi:SGNH/GDSL hydrolase family protein [Dyadobacter luticola]|uniref:SGNH/GDSL hydrolase family protein n=1 Tax=Dyadobacter luticola TaxID=1979387 RepID=A0A5R9KZM8_9BACT|nr:SGNH/GDSL hydrolase family protein [Dyadobacter luticola]
MLTSCSSLLDEVFPKRNVGEEGTGGKNPDDYEPVGDKTLAFFGDSLTIGAGGSMPYGNYVAAAMKSRPVATDGIVGQIALSIAIRQGGMPLKISVDKGKFDGVNEVKVTKINNEFLSTPINNDTYSRTGTVAGVKCTITRKVEGDEVYTIKPETESDVEIPADSVFELDDAVRLRSATQILWYGRNNIGNFNAEDEIMSALDSSIAYISDPKRYVVLGILLATPDNEGTSNYNQVMDINQKLASKYGNAYVEMTPPTPAEMSEVNYTPDSNDESDIAQKNFPRGLRAADSTDEIHLNDKGYQLVANRVAKKLKELKY